MRIGIDARLAGIHERGIGRYTFELVSHLLFEKINQEHELIIFVTQKNAHLFKARHNVEIVLADIKWYGLAEQILFPKIITESKVELMHFPHYNIPLIYNKPYIVTIHDLLLNRFPTSNASTKNKFIFFAKYISYKVIVRHALQNAKRIIAVSEFTKKEIKELYPTLTTPIEVIYEGGSTTSEEKTEITTHDLPNNYLLSVGAAYPHKNLQATIKTLVPFLRKHSLCYILVGRDDYFYKRLKHDVEANNYSDVVHFYGEVSNAYLEKLYTNAIALLFPSNYEGFGLPALEAMLYDCPVIASNKGALPEIIGDAGIVVNDVQLEFPRAILSLVEYPSLRIELIKKGKQRASRFSWGNMAKKTKILYN